MNPVVAIADVVDRNVDVNELLAAVRTPDAGAVVAFLGTVRRSTHGRETASLTYEAYRSMAVQEIRRVLEGVASDWPICRIAAEHRIGDLELGDIAVVVTVSGPHRDETFAAGRAAIDRLKETVPIWKREHWADGDIEWVDPTADAAPVQTNPVTKGPS